MSYFEVTVTQKDEEGNDHTLDMMVNPDQVFCIIKPPLQSPVVCMMTVNLMVQSAIPKVDGLVEVETKEGGTAQINKSHVLFYYSPSLGIYVLTFPGGTRVAVRATGAEMKTLLGGGPSIVV